MTSHIINNSYIVIRLDRPKLVVIIATRSFAFGASHVELGVDVATIAGQVEAEVDGELPARVAVVGLGVSANTESVLSVVRDKR